MGGGIKLDGTRLLAISATKQTTGGTHERPEDCFLKTQRTGAFTKKESHTPHRGGGICSSSPSPTQGGIKGRPHSYYWTGKRHKKSAGGGNYFVREARGVG